MPSNDYLKSHVEEEIQNLKNNANEVLKEKGVQAEKSAKRFNCFVCMDTRKLWAWRRDGFSTSIFSSHKYDIIHCNGCSTGKDIQTTNSIQGYEKNNCSDVNGRINDLVNYYHAHIKQEEERKHQAALEKKKKEKENLRKQLKDYESRNFSVWGKGGYHDLFHYEEDRTIDINISIIANKIFQIVRSYGGDYISIANLAKNLCINLSHSISKDESTKEVFDHSAPDEFGNSKYIIIKFKKIEEKASITKFKVYRTTTSKTVIQATFLLLSPLNSLARIECQKMIHHEANNIIDKMKQHVN